MKAWQIVLIVVGSVLVAGGIAVGVFFILKNRKNAVAEAEETTEENAPEAETAPEAEAAPEAETAPEAENAPETSASEAENEEERPKE
jgi:flagellar basal body-associated protein FliL